MKDSSESSKSPQDEPDLGDFTQKKDHCGQCERDRIGKELSWEVKDVQSQSEITGSEREDANLDVDENELSVGGKAEASAEQGLVGKLKGTLGINGGYARRDREIDREANRSIDRDRVSNKTEVSVIEHDERLDQDPTYKVCRGHETPDWTYAVEKERRNRLREFQRANEKHDRRNERSRDQRRDQSSNKNQEKISTDNDRTPGEESLAEGETTQDRPEDRDDRSTASILSDKHDTADRGKENTNERVR